MKIFKLVQVLHFLFEVCFSVRLSDFVVYTYTPITGRPDIETWKSQFSSYPAGFDNRPSLVPRYPAKKIGRISSLTRYPAAGYRGISV